MYSLSYRDIKALSIFCIVGDAFDLCPSRRHLTNLTQMVTIQITRIWTRYQEKILASGLLAAGRQLSLTET